MYKGKIGVGIVSFDRPDYLRRLTDSLAENDTSNTEFVLFQDGAVNKFSGNRYAEDDDIRTSVEVFNSSSLPNKEIVAQEYNVNIAYNHLIAHDTLTDNYEYCMVLETDQVVSPYFLRVMRILAGQYLDNDFIFSVSCGHRKLCSDSDIDKYIDRTKFVRGHWWAEMFTAQGYEKFRPAFMQYFKFTEGRDHKQRPHKEILNFFESVGAGGYRTTCQDAGKDVACYMTGMGRIRPWINRGINIGEKGVNFGDDADKISRYINQKPYVFNSDATLKEFKLVL